MRPIGTIQSCFSTRYNDPIACQFQGSTIMLFYNVGFFEYCFSGFAGTGHRGSHCLFLLRGHVWSLIRLWFLLHLLRVLTSTLTAGYYTCFISTLISRSYGENHLSLSSRQRYARGLLFCFYVMMFSVWRFLGCFQFQVRVPRLNGERKGVFATRSPHRPCPIGLTVAKVLRTQIQFFCG